MCELSCTSLLFVVCMVAICLAASLECGRVRLKWLQGGWSPAAAAPAEKRHVEPSLLPSRSYEEGGNISDAEVLLEVGRQLGLPEAELQAALG